MSLMMGLMSKRIYLLAERSSRRPGAKILSDAVTYYSAN